MKNKTLIIGGSRGIGLDIAKKFKTNNDSFLILSRNKSNIKNHKVFDINNLSHHSLDFGFINNIIFSHRIRNSDAQNDYLSMVINPIKFIFKQLNKLKNNSCIIFLGSNAHKFVYKEQDVFYHASRGAIYSMTKYLAYELGKKKIRVNCINPSTLIKEENKNFFGIKANRKNLEKIIPYGELTKSKQIAELCYFLCSKNSTGINGQIISLDNGLSVVSQETTMKDILG